MRLTPAEEDRLTIFSVAELARRRLRRGCLLSAPEAIAIITDEVLEAAWDGLPLAQVVVVGMSAVPRESVRPGVPGLVRRVEVEALSPTGTFLVTVDDPLGPADLDAPGAVLVGAPTRELNPGRERLEIEVHNQGDVTIRVTSHYPFWQANGRLAFDREAATGYRLDIPSGSSIAFASGERRNVVLVALAGRRTAPQLRLRGAR